MHLYVFCLSVEHLLYNHVSQKTYLDNIYKVMALGITVVEEHW